MNSLQAIQKWTIQKNAFLLFRIYFALEFKKERNLITLIKKKSNIFIILNIFITLIKSHIYNNNITYIQQIEIKLKKYLKENTYCKIFLKTHKQTYSDNIGLATK